MKAQIRIEGLRVGTKHKDILKDIDLIVPERAVTAIIGMSGCGKSTLLHSLNQTLGDGVQIHGGKIFLDDMDISGMDVGELRKKVGLIGQQPTVFPFSLINNMLYALNYHRKGTTLQRRETAVEALKAAGLYDEVKDMLDSPAGSLSGGQQQRLCIARALALEPQVLLLDEPCSALDIKSTLRIEETLKKLKDRCAVLIVTHNLSQAKRLADYVVYMEKGQIIERRTTEDLFSHPEREETKTYLSYILRPLEEWRNDAIRRTAGPPCALKSTQEPPFSAHRCTGGDSRRVEYPGEALSGSTAELVGDGAFSNRAGPTDAGDAAIASGTG